MKEEKLLDERNDVVLQYKNPLREEYHPQQQSDFPYHEVVRRFHLGECGAPWHWHREFEFFFLEKGSLEYRTPKHRMIFEEGACALVNSNILHRTRILESDREVIQNIYIFAPELIGERESRIFRKYVEPLIESGQEIFVPEEAAALLKRCGFPFRQDVPGYEIRVRNFFSEVLLLCGKDLQSVRREEIADEKLLGMMAFVEAHISEKLTVKRIAEAVYVSERDCYRKFEKGLGETPLSFLQSVRMELACQLLKNTNLSTTEIAQRCGLGTGSYFSSVFSKNAGCTPGEYRKKTSEKLFQ